MNAFFAAAHDGDFEALVSVLHPDVVLRADGGTARPENTGLVHGAAQVAGQAIMFSRPNVVRHPATVNGAAGAVVTVSGEPYAVMAFTVTEGKIATIDILADPERVGRLDLAEFGD